MREIPLRGKRGGTALVDDSDYENVMRYKWCLDARGYPSTTIFPNGKKRSISMHSFLIGVVRGMHGDHIDGDRLNNQRFNLRHCTVSQNAMNRKRNSNNTSGARGVTYVARIRKWLAQICTKGVRQRLGYYSTLEEAAKVALEARRLQHGEFARLD